jgi:hypothetical protein
MGLSLYWILIIEFVALAVSSLILAFVAIFCFRNRGNMLKGASAVLSD